MVLVNKKLTFLKNKGDVILLEKSLFSGIFSAKKTVFFVKKL